MSSLKIYSILLLLSLSSLVYAQKGFIRGTVYDDANGESLPGVTIYIEGTSIGTISDLDGKFNLSVDPGTYDLRVSFISYETINMPGLEVTAGEVTLLDNLRLKSATIDLNEVTVTARMVRNTETALSTIRRKSPNVLDGISASGLKTIGDSDAASSIKRVPGVSVEGGKYVFVRGLGDRYTKTILNGVEIPGLDPDRNAIQMDIFPTNLIDNIIVHKSFSADIPADFTGGIVDIATKDFPEEKKGSISLSLSYNPEMHFNSQYITYEGGATDFLGFDDGTRAIPATTDIPAFAEVIGDPNGPRGMRYQEVLSGFNPTLAAYRTTSFMDYSLGASFGNQHPGEKLTIGYNFSLSYKNNTEYYKDAEYGRYGLSGNPDIMEMDRREFQFGDYGVNSALLSGMAGLAIKSLTSKYRINLMHLQNGESTGGIFDFEGSDQGSIFSGFQHNLDYSQRSLTNLLLSGEHSLKEDTWNIEWKLSPTLARMNDPDIRFTRYVISDGRFIIGTESGFPERIWRDLEEVNLSGLFNVTHDFEFLGEESKLKFGGAYAFKERDFNVRKWALNIRDVPLTGNPNELMDPKNLWPLGGNIIKGTSYESHFFPTNPNEFTSSTNLVAGYASSEMSPFQNFRAIVGLRVEQYTQRYTGQDQLGYNILDDEVVLDDFGLFPAVNLVYTIKEMQNLRFSFSKTIARPSFKELSYAEIYDPISGRTFVGGLFRDANDLAGIEYWDGNLVSTDIFNFDLRWERFQRNGQMISVGVFYKKFLNPIEIVQYATQTGAFQPRNVGDGEVFGGEIEFKQSLEFIAVNMRTISLSGNFTLTQSRIKQSKTEYDSRLANARTGQEIKEYRDMAGQAPFLINGGIVFDGEQGFWEDFEAGVFYNVQGRTLQFVGIVDRPDIYLEPFHSLNFNANKSMGKEKQLQLGVKVSNILNDNKESVYISYLTENQYFERLHPGLVIQFRMAYNLF